MSSIPESDRDRFDRYLFAEMTEEERDQFEELLFADEELFHLAAEREDDLIDRYVRGRLSAGETTRFERSLKAMPARRERLKNARAFQAIAKESRDASAATDKTITIAERGRPGGFWQFFGFNGPRPAIAAAAVIILLLAGLGYLSYRNNLAEQELARLRDQTAGSERVKELESRLAEAGDREVELAAAVDSERDVSGDLTADLESARKERDRLSRELATLREQRPDVPRPPAVTPQPPTIATITLAPAGARGGETFSLDLHSNVKRVSVLLTLPADADANERISIRLNGREIAKGLKVRSGPKGMKSVTASIAANEFTAGTNHITAHNSSGREIGEYELAADKEEK